MATAEKRTIVSAQITAADAEHLRRLAHEADRSVSAELGRAISEHLERESEAKQT